MSLNHSEMNKVKENELITVDSEQINDKTSSAMKLYNDKLKESGSIAKKKWLKFEWMEKEVIPEKELDKQVKEAYAKANDGEKIGYFEKVKAKKEARKKQGKMLKAARTYSNFYAKNALETVDIDEIAHDVKQGDEMFMRDAKGLTYLIEDKAEKIDFYKGLKDGDDQKKVELIKPKFEQILAMEDFSKYNFKNDDELIKNFYKYRKELMVGFTLKNIITEYKNRGGELEIYDEAKLVAIAETLQAIFNIYDGRMKFLQNPNYALLRDKTFAGMDEKDIRQYARQLDDTNAAPDLVAYLRQRADVTFYENSEREIGDRAFIFHGNDVERVYNEAFANQTKELFLTKNLEWNPASLMTNEVRDTTEWAEAELSDEQIEQKIRDAYDQISRSGGPKLTNKILNKLKANYRAKQANAKKADEIIKLIKNCHVADDYIIKEEHYEDLSRSTQAMTTLYKTTEDKKNYLAIMKGNDVEEKRKTVEAILEKMKKIDISRFDFKDDNEFFRIAAGLLVEIAPYNDSISVLVEVEKEAGGKLFSNDFKIEYYTKAKTLQAILIFYQERIGKMTYQGDAIMNAEDLISDKGRWDTLFSNFTGDEAITNYFFRLNAEVNQKKNKNGKFFSQEVKAKDLEKDIRKEVEMLFRSKG